MIITVYLSPCQRKNHNDKLFALRDIEKVEYQISIILKDRIELKILHLISSVAPVFGGTSSACIDMAEATAKLGHKVSIYSTNMAGKQDLDVPLDTTIIKNNVEYKYFQVNTPRFWKPSISMAKALKNNIPNFDLVQIHALYLFQNFIGGHYCRKFNIPYIVTPHGSLDPFLYKRHRWRKSLIEVLYDNNNLRKASAIHFTTEEEKLLAEKHCFGTTSIIVPNGLDTTVYDRLPPKGTFQKLYPETKGKQIILFFSRLSFKKGLDILAPAFINLAKQNKSYHLVLAGPDNEGLGDWVKQQVKDAGISVDGNDKRVTVTGMLKDEAKLSALNDASLFILPSYTENFGIAVIEAMLCGLPVIISDKVNIWRDVKTDNAGLVGPCDIDWFTDNIKKLLADKELCSKMGDAGIKSVKKRYDWNKIALQLESEYKKILASKE